MAEHGQDVLVNHPHFNSHVLAPYLEYAYLRRQVDVAPPARIEAFLDDHAELPVTRFLRQRYLLRLAEAGEWTAFNRYFDDESDTTLRCFGLQARASQEAVGEHWIREGRDLWLAGRSQPKACDPVFDVLYRKGALTQSDYWQRITLAMAEGETGLAIYLSRKLGPAWESRVQTWVYLTRHPHRLAHAPLTEDATTADIVGHVYRRWARRSPADAYAWREQLATYVPAEEALALLRYVTIWAAIDEHPEAYAWLAGLPPAAVTEEVLVWRARMAIRAQAWRDYRDSYALMPETLQKDKEWAYWQAYALKAAGEVDRAEAIFAELARERSYYGFLAADKLHQPYAMSHRTEGYSIHDLADLESHAGIRRAKALYAEGLIEEARREWLAALEGRTEGFKTAAAFEAARIGWASQAIMTANNAGLHDDLELRFPLAFQSDVERVVGQHRVTPAQVMAVIRKESIFSPDAVSPVGARGLMQLMPATARVVARKHGIRYSRQDDLFNVETNVQLGSAYLAELLDKYHGNLALAAAAYNAGPHRVDQWLDEYQDLPPEIWVESIPFRETRNYVKAVLAFSAVFDWKLGAEPTRVALNLRSGQPRDGACMVATIGEVGCR